MPSCREAFLPKVSPPIDRELPPKRMLPRDEQIRICLSAVGRAQTPPLMPATKVQHGLRQHEQSHCDRSMTRPPRAKLLAASNFQAASGHRAARRYLKTIVAVAAFRFPAEWAWSDRLAQYRLALRALR